MKSIQHQQMTGEYAELSDLLCEMSNRSFSCTSWYCNLLDVVKHLLAGKPWKDQGFDTECCEPPAPHDAARMALLIGKLGGCWDYGTDGYEWIPLSKLLEAKAGKRETVKV